MSRNIERKLELYCMIPLHHFSWLYALYVSKCHVLPIPDEVVNKCWFQRGLNGWMSLSAVWACASVVHQRFDHNQMDRNADACGMPVQIILACCSAALEHSRFLIMQCRECGNLSFTLHCSFAQKWILSSFSPHCSFTLDCCSPLLCPPVLRLLGPHYDGWDLFYSVPIRTRWDPYCSAMVIFIAPTYFAAMVWYTCIIVVNKPATKIYIGNEFSVPCTKVQDLTTKCNKFLEWIGRTR